MLDIYKDPFIHVEQKNQSCCSRFVNFVNRPVYWLLGTKTIRVTTLNGNRHYEIGKKISFDLMTASACLVYACVIPLLLLFFTLAISYFSTTPKLCKMVKKWEIEQERARVAAAEQERARAAAAAAEQERIRAVAAEQERTRLAMQQPAPPAAEHIERDQQTDSLMNQACSTIYNGGAAVLNGGAVALKTVRRFMPSRKTIIDFGIKQGAKAVAFHLGTNLGLDPSLISEGLACEKASNQIWGDV